MAALYSAEGGWPYGEVRDTDPILEKEKQIGGPHPVREVSHANLAVSSNAASNPADKTTILVTEEAKAQGVTSFNVVVPTVCEYPPCDGTSHASYL